MQLIDWERRQNMGKRKFKCICCGYKTLEHSDPVYHEVCPVCYWENDPIQNENHEYKGGANRVCLNEAKRNFAEFGATEKEYIGYVRKPLEGELGS